MIAPSDKTTIKKAADIIRAGGLVAFPTETVYGLGANALDSKAVAKIFAVKNRPSTNPLIVHIHCIEQIFDLISPAASEITKGRLKKLEALWPGPLSVVLPASENIPTLVSANTKTIAVRIPNHPVALELLRECNLPIAAPSANPSGYISPTKAIHVEESLASKVDLIIDGGSCKVGIESTVISLIEKEPMILRPGAITRGDFQNILQEHISESKSSDVLEFSRRTSPGMSNSHYAPRTPLAFFERVDLNSLKNKKIGRLSFNHESSGTGNLNFEAEICLSQKGLSEEIAANLFTALREMDKLQLDLILIDQLLEQGLGVAIMDRLNRATYR